jgi:hypothetical protein
MRKIAFVLLLVLLAAHSVADEKRFVVPLDDSPATGPADALVTIIEFLDFQ